MPKTCMSATSIINTARLSLPLLLGEYSVFFLLGFDSLIFFGRHGLSYTTFEFSDLVVSKPTISEKEVEITISLDVKNTGTVKGSETVQVYMSLPQTSELTHPPLQLRGFAKVRDLEVGKTQRVDIKLDKYAVSYWDDKINLWVVEKGEYVVKVGSSSDKLVLIGSVVLEKYFEWSGI